MMRYAYNMSGFLVGNTDDPVRSTDMAPPAHGGVGTPVIGQPWPNWTGVEWVMATYSAPPAPLAPVDPVWKWYIDIGPFFDRFGPSMMAVLLSPEPVVVAMLKNVNSRKWVDLQRPDVAAAIAYMAGQAVPGLGTIATPIAGVTLALMNSILTTPVADEENHALRKLYFS